MTGTGGCLLQGIISHGMIIIVGIHLLGGMYTIIAEKNRTVGSRIAGIVRHIFRMICKEDTIATREALRLLEITCAVRL